MQVEATTHGHWDRRTIAFVGRFLQRAERLVRIATGFFTVEGYDLIRPYLVGTQVRILVGFDETSRERLREKLVDDIMLHLSQWDTESRREAVMDIVAKLSSGELRIIEQGSPEFLDARVRKRDHAKVYIVDDTKAMVGSSNLTASGLRSNVEATTAIMEPEKVEYWTARYESYWRASDTYDLSQALLDALRAWLTLADPYDIYLKTIQALVPEDPSEAPRSSYKMPVRYQQVVIERVLRQLSEYRGAMLVASTGLGKTVMATHAAYRLREEDVLRNVLVFAPKQVKPDWERAFESAGISARVLTRDLLDRPLSKRRRSSAVQKVLDALERVDDQYLIIVDESQYFKNRLRGRDGKPRYSFRRLIETVAEKEPYIILLTATPIGKDVRDLNNQLLLLPHEAPPSYCMDDGQLAMPGVIDDDLDLTAWRVPETERYFDAFKDLPVSTVISTSQVARSFAVHTPEGDYVDFHGDLRWIPQIAVRVIPMPVPFESEMSYAIRQRYFRHQLLRFQNRGVWQRSESTIEKEAEVAWTSSPSALEDVLDKTIENGYKKLDFVRSQDERRSVLGPILDQVRQLPYEEDPKFLRLCECLREFQRDGKKAIIFIERHRTAVYLERGLAATLPYLKVANAVAHRRGEYDLKPFDEVYELILDFAPEANADKVPAGHRPKPYDVFITTDAYGAGVNLQDASVVISYDLAWTGDTIIQRAGRILRFWRHPRKVHLYVFLPVFREDETGKTATRGLVRRLERLTHRSEQAQRFSEMPVLPESGAAEYISLGDLAQYDFKDFGLAHITEIEEFSGVSKFLIHLTELMDNAERAKAVPNDIASAMGYDGDSAQLFLLLRYHSRYVWVLYDLQRKQRIPLNEDQLLDLIQCRPETPPAPIEPDEIERHAQLYKRVWCEQNNVNEPDQVERICVLYLAPATRKDGMANMLKAQIVH